MAEPACIPTPLSPPPLRNLKEGSKKYSNIFERSPVVPPYSWVESHASARIQWGEHAKRFYARERVDGQGGGMTRGAVAGGCGGPGGFGLEGCLQGSRRRAGSASGPRPENRIGENYDLLELFANTTPPVSMRAHSEPALICQKAPIFATGVLPENRCYLAARRIGRQLCLPRHCPVTACAR